MRKLVVGVSDGFDNSYKALLSKLGDITIVSFADLRKNPIDNSIDLLLFTGGADVNPAYYQENKGAHTFVDKKRDELEAIIFEKYYRVPKLGICRGSQFLTALSGGKLIQHVVNHTSSHLATVKLNANDNNHYRINVTSTHHQMLYPFNLNKKRYVLIGWSTKFLSDVYLDGDNNQKELVSDFLEPEIVYYPDTKSLAIQGHPEFDSASAEFKDVTIRLIKKYLLN